MPFKMNPITYTFDTKPYFKEFRNEQGDWVYKRDIRATPFGQKFGSGITFEIIEGKCPEGKGNVVEPLQRSQVDLFSNQKDFDYIDMSLFDGLCNNEMRGETAENAVHAIYYKYFVKGAGREWLTRYLPDLVAHWDDIEEMAKQQKEKEFAEI